MSQIPSNIPLLNNPEATSGSSNDLREVDLDSFLKLLITELQNQDPLNPMENADLLNQISQIREIGATNQLTESLEAVASGQNLATASGLIGKVVQALDDQNNEVQGVVDRVSLDTNGGTRQLTAHVGDSAIRIENIRQIRSPEEGGGALVDDTTSGTTAS